MRLAAIYNVWHDWDWLKLSVNNIRPVVDGVIIIASEVSNYGEFSRVPNKWLNSEEVFIHNPGSSAAMITETEKRNHGLKLARVHGYTHFIMMDCDEFYHHEDVLREKERFEDPDLLGLVCATQVFFKKPTLTVGLDVTLVPFIHKITNSLEHTFNQHYPFAWEGRQIRIDPTRSLNINTGVQWSDVVMFHYSWVRKDIEVKIRNSTARANIERSTLREDYANAKEGYYCQYYKAELKSCPNWFNLPDSF